MPHPFWHLRSLTTERLCTFCHGPSGRVARSISIVVPHQSLTLLSDTKTSPNHCTLTGLAAPRGLRPWMFGDAAAAFGDQPDPVQYSGAASKRPSGTRASHTFGMHDASNWPALSTWFWYCR